MSAGLTAPALDPTLRFLSGLSDSAASAAVGRPARLRVGLSPRGVLAGRVDRTVLRLDGVGVAGLEVASLTIDARRTRVGPGWPPRLRAGPVDVRAVLTQAALDRWLLADAMPVRVLLRDGGVFVRTGAAGIRLGEVRASIGVDRGRLTVIPQRAQVLGIGIPTAGLRIALPLPSLPRDASLSSVAVVDDEITIGVRVPGIDEPLSPARARELHALLARGRQPDEPPSARGAAVTRVGGAVRSRATTAGLVPPAAPI